MAGCTDPSPTDLIRTCLVPCALYNRGSCTWALAYTHAPMIGGTMFLGQQCLLVRRVPVVFVFSGEVASTNNNT